MFNTVSLQQIIIIFPILFLAHEIEEVAVQHGWMQAHHEQLTARFPRMRAAIEHLARINTPAFAIAVAEEFAVVLIATVYALSEASLGLHLWAALFIAFGVHLLIHAGQAVAVRGYVPGLATTLLLLPCAAVGIGCMLQSLCPREIVVWGLAGTVFAALNLRFAHWLALKIAK